MVKTGLSDCVTRFIVSDGVTRFFASEGETRFLPLLAIDEKLEVRLGRTGP
jgi:hypothetical protein